MLLSIYFQNLNRNFRGQVYSFGNAYFFFLKFQGLAYLHTKGKMHRDIKVSSFNMFKLLILLEEIL